MYDDGIEVAQTNDTSPTTTTTDITSSRSHGHFPCIDGLRSRQFPQSHLIIIQRTLLLMTFITSTYNGRLFQTWHKFCDGRWLGYSYRCYHRACCCVRLVRGQAAAEAPSLGEEHIAANRLSRCTAYVRGSDYAGTSLITLLCDHSNLSQISIDWSNRCIPPSKKASACSVRLLRFFHCPFGFDGDDKPPR